MGKRGETGAGKEAWGLFAGTGTTRRAGVSLSLLPQAPWLASPGARPCPLPCSEARGPVPRPGAAGPHKCRTSFFFGRVFGLLHRRIGFSRPVSSLAYFRASGGGKQRDRGGRVKE